jgi:3-deoxy-D-manno-octulosonic-acid transferase
MYTLYSVFLFFLRLVYGALSIFDPKIKRGIDGRKDLLLEIEKYYFTLTPLRKRILIHVSSFGELEQAKPVIAALKAQYPNVHIHLTFFSPSGYENAVNKYLAPDLITYLPFDSDNNVNFFLDITKPDLVLFVRYDLWHNFVHELHDRNIPMLLFSATFDPSLSKYFPLVHGIYRKTYSFVSTIYTVSEKDKMALERFAIHAKKIVVGGDTRCDQVIARKNAVQVEQVLPEEILSQISSENSKVFVAGSTWVNDEDFILPVLEKALQSNKNMLAIIVPHEVERSFPMNSNMIKLSEISHYSGEKIIIVDSIGKLFLFYQYASFAYVGGGFGAGVHNILEPAVWGVPAIVGPNHKRSKEIGAMIGLSAAEEITTAEQFEDAFNRWMTNDMSRTLAGVAAKEYVYSSKGATEKIMAEIGHIL